jgi:hypothetical protein
VPYQKLFLRRNSGSGEQHAARKHFKKQSQAGSRCMAVSLVGKRRPWGTNLPKAGDRHCAEYSDSDAASRAVAGLLREINSDDPRNDSCRMTVAEACDHFEQRELGKENNWRSYSTKKAYRVI